MDSLDRLRRGVMSLSEFAKIAEEVLALRADLEAVAVAAQHTVDGYWWHEAFAAGAVLRLKQALARPGVRDLLKAAQSGAEITAAPDTPQNSR